MRSLAELLRTLQVADAKQVTIRHLTAGRSANLQAARQMAQSNQGYYDAEAGSISARVTLDEAIVLIKHGASDHAQILTKPQRPGDIPPDAVYVYNPKNTLVGWVWPKPEGWWARRVGLTCDDGPFHDREAAADATIQTAVVV